MDHLVKFSTEQNGHSVNAMMRSIRYFFQLGIDSGEVYLSYLMSTQVNCLKRQSLPLFFWSQHWFLYFCTQIQENVVHNVDGGVEMMCDRRVESVVTEAVSWVTHSFLLLIDYCVARIIFDYCARAIFDIAGIIFVQRPSLTIVSHKGVIGWIS